MAYTAADWAGLANTLSAERLVSPDSFPPHQLPVLGMRVYPEWVWWYMNNYALNVNRRQTTDTAVTNEPSVTAWLH